MTDKTIVTNKVATSEMVSSAQKAQYTILELVTATRKIFPKYTGALVETALKETGRVEFSVEEAQTIVEKFAKREVKR